MAALRIIRSGSGVGVRENRRIEHLTPGYFESAASCVVNTGHSQPVFETIRESSFWINRSDLCRTKFGWQDEYFAVSVSEASVPAVRKYIANQDEHHRTKSFEDEFEGFMKRAGFQRFEDSEGSQ